MVHVPVESQEQVEQLIDLTHELDLPHQRAEICQTWARRLEQNHQIGSALHYFEKGQSYSDIRRICWSLFERLLLNGMSYKWVVSHVTKGEMRIAWIEVLWISCSSLHNRQ